ncbi:glycosyltransferase family 4 protein [Fulvivirga sedimenti]|uniref:Glycosyltransferase family 4 protein n=1 Tax=Fulvivirga sedimenti TaxID=2879465 RepID=A0A9X1HRU6_9BACT|nr:glycosyltransferase family 4 protein [Fulvivirga sedimenti]MCA6075224.1 glycosyltransferase family 4 protein [Fulvivirga sedimenti]MCA6076401.1 glycosyltransferase family 4 protein [Fulvivirga sedimenti]MCA6077529.1 glycosyltransferase family 4 protein [Fulvivirga sedimenti]
MKIGMILDNTFPPDSRVENEAVSLIREGHEVFLFCLNSGDQPEKEIINGIQIHRFPTNKFEYKLSALAYTIPLYHWLMRPKIKTFINETQVEVIHIHDLTIARAAFAEARKAGKRVVLDLHENRPEIMKFYVHLQKWPGKWLISTRRWNSFQKKYCHAADAVIVVTDEARQDLASEYRISEQKFAVVPNTVDTSIYLSYEPDPGITQAYKDTFNILYMGDTGLRRGTDTAILAIELLKDSIQNVKLILVGSNTEDAELREIVRKKNLEPYVHFAGWQDVSLFPSYVEIADVCLSPLKRNRHHDTTFANKIFQYMAGGKPLVVSDCPPQVRVVENSGCGLVHQAESRNSLAESIFYIHEHPEESLEMGERGRRAVMEQWNWNHTSNELRALYAGLASEPVKNQIN